MTNDRHPGSATLTDALLTATFDGYTAHLAAARRNDSLTVIDEVWAPNLLRVPARTLHRTRYRPLFTRTAQQLATLDAVVAAGTLLDAGYGHSRPAAITDLIGTARTLTVLPRHLWPTAARLLAGGFTGDPAALTDVAGTLHT